MIDIFELVKQQAEMVLRKEDLDTKVIIKENTDRTYHHSGKNFVQFGKWRIQGILGWGKESARYYIVKDDKLYSYPLRSVHTKRLSRAVKLCSLILEEIGHAKAWTLGGRGHGHIFYTTFEDLWKKYADEITKALWNEVVTYIPEVFK